jgi:Cu(I)/Ag(I) efflux system membrane protein CusA/SilA
MERAAARLRIVIPLTLFVIFMLLYFNFRNIASPLIVMLSVPFALVGGFWLVYWNGFNLSVAVGVGFIALAGVAAETGVLVLSFVETSLKDARRAKGHGNPLTPAEVMAAVQEGTSRRVRPVVMTASSTIIGLLPIMLGTGTGADVMQRIAAPMVGGMLTTTLLCLLVLPLIYALLVVRQEKRLAIESGNIVDEDLVTGN